MFITWNVVCRANQKTFAITVPIEWDRRKVWRKFVALYYRNSALKPSPFDFTVNPSH